MFTVLRSSAGAGKTHALVKHYLEHCLRGDVGAYRQVLALTFTNKAAGEMKERVMRNLAKVARGDVDNAAMRDLMAHLVHTCGVDETTLAQRAAAVQLHMLHHWGEVAISTIDAFTRRVVQPFARDLQLDHDLRMTTEERWYRDRAVEALIAEAGVDPQVTELLSIACQQLLDEERAWDPGQPLRELSTELGKESSLAPMRALHAEDPQVVKPLIARLRAETHVFRSKLERIGTEAHALIKGSGLVVEDLANGKGGYYGWFKKLKEFEEEWIEPGVNALKAFESNKWHSGKAGEQAKASLEALGPELLRLYQDAETLREEGQRAYFIRRAVLRELPAAFALDRLDQCLEALKREDGVAFFSDLTRRVAEVVREEPVPYIYERLGERYRHFLIDEFQDTSLLQWHTLLPLIDNALSTGGSALLVGDAKQAIYRWRNGEVRLFTHLPKLWPSADGEAEGEREATLERNYEAPEPLADNHRSASTIVAFNNALFGPLAEQLSADLRTVYAAHEQNAKKKDAGLVHLEKLPKDKSGEEARTAQLDFLMRSVHEAIADGFAPWDIAVLVRSKTMGRACSAHLLAAGFQVVSPDGLRLSGDPVVEQVIDLLRYLHTGDVTAAARVLQHHARTTNATGGSVDPFAVAAEATDPARWLRNWLMAQGSPSLRTTLTALVSHLAHCIGAEPAEDAQLLTLLDEVHTWSVDHGLDIGGFLEHWERSGGERITTPPANDKAVQVMTVHKAKGLEFPVVIVPNARMAPEGTHNERVWIKPGDAVPDLERTLVREGKALRSTGLHELQEEEELRTLDNLDLLYVAFTRPEQRLYAMVPERADGVTTALLQHMNALGDGTTLTLGERTAPWRTKEAGHYEWMKAPGGSGDRPAVTVRYEAPENWDSADPDPFRRYGNAVHEVLGRVQHAGMLDEAIATAVAEELIDPEEAADIALRTRELITSKELAPYYGDHLVVRTEASIITAAGRSARPDRLVFDGSLVRVLDLKTGAPAEGHEDQVRGYMELLRELGHEHVEGALLYIGTGTLIPVAA